MKKSPEFPRDTWWYRLFLLTIGVPSVLLVIIGLVFLFTGSDELDFGVPALLIIFGLALFFGGKAALLYVATGSVNGNKSQPLPEGYLENLRDEMLKEHDRK